MLSYILRRLLLMIPTLLGITIVVFATMALSPGGITAQSLVDDFGMNPQEKAALEAYYNKRYGLDKPAPVQYLRWLNNVSPIGFEVSEEGTLGRFSWRKGIDLGESFLYGRPVSQILAERVPITLLLNVLTIPIIYLISIAVGVRAATDRGGRFDITSSIVMLALWSIPTMLTGVLLIGFFASEQYWHWFPPSGLSSLEAARMPFLPHWERFADVARLLGGMLAGFAAGAALAQWRNRTGRIIVAVLVGLLCATGMIDALPHEFSWVAWFWTALLLGGVFYATAGSDYPALRLVAFAFFGLCLGGALGAQWGASGFVRGFLLDRLWHLVLPVFCLAYGGFAFLARLTRSAVLENLQADYARTARAKGVPEKEVLWAHVFRNSLLPLITVFAALLPGLLGGSVIVETLFSIDGMGKLAVEAVKGRDREMVLSITLISGFLTLVGYLLADLLYAAADPRVSYD
ncbi:MAG TPA: ABC transporter permease [Gammaproteobacteria bacterium]|nr:ABC transporter permease [Gammaproteobacteria bacterium]